LDYLLTFQIGYEQIKGVCLRVAFNLKQEIQLTELSTKVSLVLSKWSNLVSSTTTFQPEFAINKKGAFRTDVYRVRLPDFDRIAYTLGEEITVTLQNTLFRFTDEEMLAWVGAFGKTTSQPR